MDRRKFLGRLFGTAAAVVVAPSVFAELKTPTATPVVIEPKTPPWIGLGLREQMEQTNRYEYTILTDEKLAGVLNDLIAKDAQPKEKVTLFGSNLRPLKSKYHR